MRALAVVVVLFAVVATATRYDVLQIAPGNLRVISELEAPLMGFANPNVVAVGEFNYTLLHIGWDTMKIVTNPSFNDTDQAYAAGFFEGQVTTRQAHQHYNNSYGPQPISDKILEFLNENVQWMESQIDANNATDPFWMHVGLLWRQWHGMLDGMNSQTSNEVPPWTLPQLLSLTSMGDMFDLRGKFDPQSSIRQEWRGMGKKEYDRWFAANTHCSCLYKLTGDLSDIYFGHTSWYYFREALRIFKTVTLNFQAAGTAAKTVRYSSYPGFMSSFDDFYLTDSGISAIETSLAILNTSVYVYVKPQTLLYWVRIMVANRMATTAPEWTQIISRYNSGTYNNQWMVLDLKQFTPGKPLPANTMWIAEQIPGQVGTRDVTDILSFGYFPSFNVPLIPEIFAAAGYPEGVKTQGPEMNGYEDNVRNEIFRRDQGTVTDLESFKHIMQYNDYEVDPISKGNPLYAIAARVDLDPEAPQCFGAYDCKVSSWGMWKNGLTVEVFAGPTPQQPRFAFNHTLATDCGPHVGVPEVFDFKFQVMKP